jgi:hypothetical protein
MIASPVEVPVGQEPATSQSVAREIMGKNVFGIEEAVLHFGVIPKKRELAYLEEVPFSEEELLLRRESSYALVAFFRKTLLDVRRVARGTGQGLFNPHWWYDNRPFAMSQGHVGWGLVRTTPVAGTSDKTWKEKLSFLPRGEEVPTARVMVYSIIGLHLATGERILEEESVCCADIDTSGNHVYVGQFGHGGLFIGAKQDACSEKRIGLASVLRR